MASTYGTQCTEPKATLELQVSFFLPVTLTPLVTNGVLREEALDFFRKSPFFGAWTREVLDLYVKYALTDVPLEQGGGVKLKMSGFNVGGALLLFS